MDSTEAAQLYLQAKQHGATQAPPLAQAPPLSPLTSHGEAEASAPGAEEAAGPGVWAAAAAARALAAASEAAAKAIIEAAAKARAAVQDAEEEEADKSDEVMDVEGGFASGGGGGGGGGGRFCHSGDSTREALGRLGERTL